MYKVNYAKYLASAAWKSQWPDHVLPEIVLSGRSNVGKSSFINTITNHSKLAKVSSTPGKTRTLNFFEMYEYAKYYEIPVIVVATKEDKLKRNDLKKNEKIIKDTLNFDKRDKFVRFSSLNKVGIDQVWDEILHLCFNEVSNNEEV